MFYILYLSQSCLQHDYMLMKYKVNKTVLTKKYYLLYITSEKKKNI